MNRRNFLRISALGGVSLFAGTSSLINWMPRAHAAAISVSLTAVRGNITLADGTSALVFTFSDSTQSQFPGPTIVCQEGDSITVVLKNSLATQTAFKLGGTDQRMVLAAGSTKSITFSAPKAGTYLYYDDLNGGVNRVMGLHGTLVVMPLGLKNQSFVGGPTFVRQYKWLLANLDSNWSSLVANNGDNYVASGKLTVNNFTPRYFTINGFSYPKTHNYQTDIYGAYGEAALIRLLNAGMATHSPHYHGNHVDILSVNRNNFIKPKTKDIVSMFPLDCRDVLFPMKRPPDAYPPVVDAEQHFPMHCHSEMSQTAGGGYYPHGMHGAIMMGMTPTTESDLTLQVQNLP